MPSLVALLTSRLQAAIGAAFGDGFAEVDPVLRRSSSPEFGDYQANVAMALAKRVGAAPRDVAARIVDALAVSDVCSSVSVAGPGFINLTLSSPALAGFASELLADERLGVSSAASPDRVVIDYSSPNLAKEMHVGHLRSTIIGDALARTLGFAGHAVVRQNHFGEWGTQFGMLIEHLAEDMAAGAEEVSIADLNAFYQEANARFKDDEAFRDRARQRVVGLQSGDPESVGLWRRFVQASLDHAAETYALLGVTLGPDDARPESSFNEELDGVASSLEAAGLAWVDDGALCAFPEGFKNRDGEPLALIVRKSDGGYGYQATDLAALRYRASALGATRIIYVVDARQAQHLSMVFTVARAAGWVPEGVRVEHVSFGMVLGPDGRPYQTRTGENVKLSELLREAVERAAAVVAEKNPSLDPAVRSSVARVVGIGAIKYADLSSDRIKDYVFDWSRMLAFEGNTAPYLQYAHARIRSLFRRASVSPASVLGSPVVVGEDAERALVLQLVGFSEVVDAVVESLQPHRLCTYLFDTAQAFTAFYEQCPVLRAPDEGVRSSRLALSELTARTLAVGLELLGIEAPDQM